MSLAEQRTAALLADLQTRLKRVERTNSLSRGSIVNGGSITAYQPSTTNPAEVGNPGLIVGTQHDGSYTAAPVSGPLPPRPAPVTATPELHAARINWPGTYLDPTSGEVDIMLTAPMDFARVEIHAGPTADFSAATADTLVGTYETPRGGDTFIPLAGDQPLWVKLVTRSLAGRRSVASPAVEVTPQQDTPGAEAAQQTADGKNSVTYSTAAPGEAPNAEGDVWFQRDAITSSIIAQWEGLGGTAWASRSLDNAVIANLDAGKITFGAMSGDRLAADALYGKRMVGADIKTAETGERVEINLSGLRSFRADGSLRTAIGALNTFGGDVDATSIQIRDQLALRGLRNVFAKGSRVTLESTQSVPSNPATLLVGHEEVPVAGTGYTVTGGMHLNSAEGSPAYTSNIFNVGRHVNGASYYVWPTVTLPNGNAVSEWCPNRSTRIYYGGGPRAVSVITHWTSASTTPKGIYLYVHNDTIMNNSGTIEPTVVSGLRINDFNWFHEYALGRVFAGVGDSSNRDKFAYGFAQKTLDGSAWSIYCAVLTPNGSGGFTTSHSANIPALPRMSTDETLTGIQYGSSARMKFHGAEQYVWVISTSKWNYVYSLNGSTRLTDLEFPPAHAAPHTTFTIGDLATGDFNGFRAMEHQALNFRMRRYTDITWSGDGTLSDPLARWWVTYRWRNKVTEATTRQTVHGPTVDVLMKKRAMLTVASPEIPPPAAGVDAARNAAEDVWTFRYFLGRAAAAPASGSMWLQTVQPGDLVTSVPLTTTPATSGTSLNTAFTAFAGAIPAEIVSSDLSDDGLPKLHIPGSGIIRAERVNERYLQRRVTGVLSANQSIAGAGAFVKVTSISVDNPTSTTRPGPATAWNLSSGTFTIPEDGYYRIDFVGQFGTGAGGTFRIAAIFIDNTEHRRFTAPAGSFRSASVWFEGNLVSGTTVDFRVVQDSGANIDLLRTINGGNERDTWFVIRRISDIY